MIQVNLHPTGGAASRRKGSRRPTLAVPKWARGGAGERDAWSIAAVAAPLLALLACGALWFFQRSDTRELDARLTQAAADSVRLSDLRALSDSLARRDSLIKDRLELVRDLDRNRFVWPHLLDELTRALPDYTWLTAVKRNMPLPGLELQVQGLAANPLAITTFVRNLQASPYVGQVRILGSQQELVQDVIAQRFSLLLSYTEPPPELVVTRPVVPGQPTLGPQASALGRDGSAAAASLISATAARGEG